MRSFRAALGTAVEFSRRRIVKRPWIPKKQMEKVHPYIPQAYDQLTEGRITRREFMRMATLLGMSASVLWKRSIATHSLSYRDD